MKSAAVILQSAALLASAAAQDAFLWTIDHGSVKHTSSQSSSISSDVASSIIARRRGSTDGRYLHTTEEADLSTINTFGGYQKPLFGASNAVAPEKIMIRISGFDGTISQFQALPDLWVDRPSIDLLDGFQARHNVDGVCEYSLKVPSKQGVDIVYSYNSKDATCRSLAEVEMLPAVLTVSSATPTAKDVVKDFSALFRMLNHLAVTGNVETTLILLPSAAKLHKSRARRLPQAEEPLDLPSVEPEESSQEVGTLQQSNSTHPLPKIIPQCFTSEATCNNVTNSCSNHGSCYKAHANCFKCRCGTTVLQRQAGKKTIQWGGNACQKKDVSMPFALFATYGIVMTAVIAGGIGMLYSMGAQELPSVLGAGVTGPKAHK